METWTHLRPSFLSEQYRQSRGSSPSAFLDLAETFGRCTDELSPVAAFDVEHVRRRVQLAEVAANGRFQVSRRARALSAPTKLKLIELTGKR